MHKLKGNRSHTQLQISPEEEVQQSRLMSPIKCRWFNLPRTMSLVHSNTFSFLFLVIAEMKFKRNDYFSNGLDFRYKLMHSSNESMDCSCQTSLLHFQHYITLTTNLQLFTIFEANGYLQLSPFSFFVLRRVGVNARSPTSRMDYIGATTLHVGHLPRFERYLRRLAQQTWARTIQTAI